MRSFLIALACASLAAFAASDEWDPANPVAPACGASNVGTRYAGAWAFVAVGGEVHEPPAGTTFTPGVGWTADGGFWRLLGRYPDLQVLIDWGDFSRLQELRQPVSPPTGICSHHRYPAAGTYDQQTRVFSDGVEIGRISTPHVVEAVQ
ncbi:hypothetical protein [Longimicrobium sp.]|uniref:hypothetical protein n=1 Tax=Longimicrobium sp. TaxID=2029185 RepID=UPI003B3AA7FF